MEITLSVFQTYINYLVSQEFYMYMRSVHSDPMLTYLTQVTLSPEISISTGPTRINRNNALSFNRSSA